VDLADAELEQWVLHVRLIVVLGDVRGRAVHPLQLLGVHGRTFLGLGFENAGIPGVFTTLRWLQLLRRLVVFVLFVSEGKLFVAGSMTLEENY